MRDPAPSGVRKYAYIDSLRAIAILGVVFMHSAILTPSLGGRIATIAMQGARGVQLFFVASALTLVMSWNSRAGRESRPVMFYFIRRFFRIAPLFYCGIIFYLWQRGRAATSWEPWGVNNRDIFLTATFLHGWTPRSLNSVVPGGWSIAVEMMFYVAFPVLVKYLTDIPKVVIAIVVSLVLGAALRSLILHLTRAHFIGPQPEYLLTSFAWMWFPSQVPVFLCGFLCYFILKGMPPTGSKMLAVALFASSLLLMASLLHTEDMGYLPFWFVAGVASMLLAWSLSIWPQRWLVNAPMRYLGTISFSGYITHFFVLDVLAKRVPPAIASHPSLAFGCLFFPCIIATVAISSLTYRFIEQPGIRLGNWIIKYWRTNELAEDDS